MAAIERSFSGGGSSSSSIIGSGGGGGSSSIMATVHQPPGQQRQQQQQAGEAAGGGGGGGGAAAGAAADPRYVNRKSGVTVLEDVVAAWAEVRNDANTEVDWMIVGYCYPGGKKKAEVVTTLSKGYGGIDACSASLPVGQAVFGGCRLKSNGRFVHFFFVDDDTPVMMRGRASMHKNAVLNVLAGTDCEIEMQRNIKEEELKLPIMNDNAAVGGRVSPQRKSVKLVQQPPATMSHAAGKAPTAVVDLPRMPLGRAKSVGAQLGISSSASPSSGFHRWKENVPNASSSSSSATTTATGECTRQRSVGRLSEDSMQRVLGSKSPSWPRQKIEVVSGTSNAGTSFRGGGGLCGDFRKDTTKNGAPLLHPWMKESQHVSYADLKDIKDLSTLPMYVDPFHREKALSKSEFRDVFGMDRVAFDKLPTWKKTSLKKSKGLF